MALAAFAPYTMADGPVTITFGMRDARKQSNKYGAGGICSSG